jgi:integrase/recombinase XerD
MPKLDRHGQAAVLSDIEVNALLRAMSNPKHRLLFTVALYTGERWGAVCRLQVADVYADPTRAVPASHITFRASTRKARPDGTRETRQVPVHPALADVLRAHRPPGDGWLFPSAAHPDKPISFDAADAMLRKAIARARLADKGISTHSTRRTAITRMARAGMSPKVIQAVTGHRSLSVVMRYVDVAPEQIAAAVAAI